jgi:hypothetical protein
VPDELSFVNTAAANVAARNGDRYRAIIREGSVPDWRQGSKGARPGAFVSVADAQRLNQELAAEVSELRRLDMAAQLETQRTNAASGDAAGAGGGGYTQDPHGRWHGPNGGYVSAAEATGQAPEAEGGGGAGGGGLNLGRTVLAGLGGALAGAAVGGASALLSPIIGQVLQTATSPLGMSGGAVAQIGTNLMNVIGTSIQSAATIGGTVTGGIMGLILGSAVGGPVGGMVAGFIGGELAGAFSKLAGAVGEAASGALKGFVDILKDIVDVGTKVADTVMNISYSTGQSAGAVSGMVGALQAGGMQPDQIMQAFGGMGGNPALMQAKLGVFGANYTPDNPGEMEVQIHRSLEQMPAIMRESMLRMAFGAAGPGMLPMLMRPEDEIRSSAAMGQKYAATGDDMKAIQQHLEPQLQQLGLAFQQARVQLLTGLMPGITVALQTATSFLKAHSEEIVTFLTQTAPKAIMGFVTEAFTYLADHAAGLVEAFDWLKIGATAVVSVFKWFAHNFVDLLIEGIRAIPMAGPGLALALTLARDASVSAVSADAESSPVTKWLRDHASAAAAVTKGLSESIDRQTKQQQEDRDKPVKVQLSIDTNPMFDLHVEESIERVEVQQNWRAMQTSMA